MQLCKRCILTKRWGNSLFVVDSKLHPCLRSKREKKKEFDLFSCATESLTYMPTGPCGPSGPDFPVKPCKTKAKHDVSNSSHTTIEAMFVNSLFLLGFRGVLEVPLYLQDPGGLKIKKSKQALTLQPWTLHQLSLLSNMSECEHWTGAIFTSLPPSQSSSPFLFQLLANIHAVHYF